MGHTTGDPDPAEQARRFATDPTLPAWAVEVCGLLLDGDDATLDMLEQLATEAAWLYGKGRAWLTERPPR